ncbi:unnamed protein product [Linum tenue]|uniref:Pentatricopeptide repeat-containing protein n=1 Tax=Linum tenue TaxID=586396 RepID=A0AAV0RNE7_9ROSI|nr:unnamed protein product [Linum tenue]
MNPWLAQSKPSALLRLRYVCTLSRSHASRLEPHNSTNLLGAYFKSGRVSDAEKLFDKMSDRNVVSWSIAIHGYAINGHHVKSINAFTQMRHSGLVPNSFTVVGVLISTAGLSDLVLGRSVHGLAVKSGLQSESIVATAVLDMYAKCGNVFDSYKVFEELKDLHLVSCNAIVAGFIANGLCRESFVLFGKLRKAGLTPNSSTMLTLIRGCIGLGIRILSESIHCLIIKLGLGLDVSVNNAVIGMYSSFLDISATGKVFQEMECKDIISWTTMMGLLVGIEDALGAIRLYFEMKGNGFYVDAVVIMHLILVSAALGNLNVGRQVHAQAVFLGLLTKLTVVNSLIKMYLKCGDLDSSSTLFDGTAEKSPVTWTAMISGLTNNGHARAALDLMGKTRWDYRCSLDSVSISSAIIACGEISAFEFCLQLHCYASKMGYAHHVPTSNSLISAYSKCGNVQLAHIVFKDMVPFCNVASWNMIISGYGINSQGEHAVALYHEMLKDGNEEPDSATYSAVLTACSHAGLIDEGVMIFNQMVEDGKVKPSEEHFGCVIDLLARAGFVDDASGFAKKFPEKMSLNAWKALLGGCSVHGDLQVAEHAARRVFEQEYEESGEVVLLSNLYASVGRFEDAEALRLRIENKGLSKDPGSSFVNGLMHYDCG